MELINLCKACDPRKWPQLPFHSLRLKYLCRFFVSFNFKSYACVSWFQIHNLFVEATQKTYVCHFSMKWVILHGNDHKLIIPPSQPYFITKKFGFGSGTILLFFKSCCWQSQMSLFYLSTVTVELRLWLLLRTWLCYYGKTVFHTRLRAIKLSPLFLSTCWCVAPPQPCCHKNAFIITLSAES